MMTNPKRKLQNRHDGLSLLCGLGVLGADRRRDGQCIYNRNKGLNGKRTDDVGIASGASNELKGTLGLQRTVNLSEVPSHRGHYRNKNCHNGHAKYNHMHHIDAGQTLHAALKCQQDHGRNGDGHGNLAADAQQGLKQIGDDDRLCADRTGKDTKIMTDTQTDTRLLNSFPRISPKEEQPYL